MFNSLSNEAEVGKPSRCLWWPWPQRNTVDEYPIPRKVRRSALQILRRSLASRCNFSYTGRCVSMNLISNGRRPINVARRRDGESHFASPK